MGFTQEQFAAKLGGTCLTVNRWENGHTKPSPMAIESIGKTQRRLRLRMFKCYISVPLPLCKADSLEQWNPTIAEFDYDPGLQKGEIIRANGVQLVKTNKNGKRGESNYPKYSFDAIVTERKKTITSVGFQDYFNIWISLEVADKELLHEMVESLITTFPGVLERIKPNSEA